MARAADAGRALQRAGYHRSLGLRSASASQLSVHLADFGAT